MRSKRFIIGTVLVVMVLTMVMGTALAGNNNKGSGAPSGPHYTLNILGKAWDDDDPINCGQGHRIFVKLGEPPDSQGQGGKKERTEIFLYSCEEVTGDSDCMEFGVLDCDGTDDGEASFMLPDPNPGDESRTTRYSAYIRALGKPGGIADINTCATYEDPCTGETLVGCGETITIERKKGQDKKGVVPGGQGSQKFRNVSKELLTVCIIVGYDSKGDPIWERVYIFDPRLEEEVWNYDNKGLRHAQIRFYYVPPEEYSVEEWECPVK
ncbi:MAG: hypothetical protein ACYS0I_15095 [Planctomycetota bacterium]|jgi:hypothetical protein